MERRHVEEDDRVEHTIAGQAQGIERAMRREEVGWAKRRRGMEYEEQAASGC